MNTKYERTIVYDSGRDSVFNENAGCLTEALDRELKFVVTNANSRRELVSITIRENND